MLTQKEVDSLKVGTRVWVTWAGGNGPHRYWIGRQDGVTFALTAKSDTVPAANQHLTLDFVGEKSFHTHVWRRKSKTMTGFMLEARLSGTEKGTK